MSREVRLLLKARDAAFRSGDAEGYSSSRANLKRGIRTAKLNHKRRIEEHFHNNSDPRRMWQGIKSLADYQKVNTPPPDNDTLPDELNHFYARFDRDNKTPAIKVAPPPNEQPLSLSTSAVQDALSKVNERKAAGPDGIPGRVLRACAGQLSPVLADIFNLSLAQGVVPTCLKTSTIVPVPKQSATGSLNDFRPVALTPVIAKCFERLILAHLKACHPPHWTPISLPTGPTGLQRTPYRRPYTLP